jgi:hypothetical protein
MAIERARPSRRRDTGAVSRRKQPRRRLPAQVGFERSRADLSVIQVLMMSFVTHSGYSAHLIDDGEEIGERLLARRHIW